MESRRVVRYSEAFKLQVVREVESGHFSSVWAACAAYEIKGASTVYRWMRKYGRGHLLAKVIRVEKPEEASEMKKANKRIRDLEKALADSQLDLVLARAELEITREYLENREAKALKKKRGSKPSSGA